MSDNKQDLSGLRKRQMLVGRASKMRDAGYSVSEIATALKLQESEIRPIMDIVYEAHAVRTAKQ